MTDGLHVSKQHDEQGILTDAAGCVSGLRTLAAELLAREVQVRERLMASRIEIEKTRAARLAACESQFQNDKQVLATRVALGREQLNKERSVEISRVTVTRDSAVAEHDRQTRKLTDLAKENVEEGQWLAETMVESIRRKASQERASFLKCATDALDELRILQVGTPARHHSDQAPSDLPDAAEDPERIASMLRGESVIANEASMRLRAAMTSAWMSWIPAVSAAVLVALVSLGVSVFLGPEAASKVTLYAVISATGLFGGFAALRFALRSKCRPLADSRDIAFARVERLAEVLNVAAQRVHDARIDGATARRDSEVIRTKSRAEFDAKSLDARRKEFLALKSRHDREVDDEIKRWDNRTIRLEEEAVRLAEELNANRAARAGEIETEAAAALTQAASQAQESLSAIRSKWDLANSEFLHRCTRIRSVASCAAPAWNDESGKTSEDVGELPETVSLGELSMARHHPSKTPPADSVLMDAPGEGEWNFPIGLDLRAAGSLLVYHDSASREKAVALLNNAMLRLLERVPAGKARFTIVDPVALGENFASFMHLSDIEPIIVSDRIWTEARHIEQRLSDITEHMELVIQKYLRNQFATIHEYNAQAEEVAEALRFLVIADFPTNLTDAALARLKGIIQSGQRCGVYVLMMTDSKPKEPMKSILSELERNALTIRATADSMRPSDSRLSDGVFMPELPPTGELLSRVLDRLGDKIRDSAKVRVPFSSVAPDAVHVWSRSSAQELSVELGRAGARRMQCLTLGKGMAQHALVAGRTGSGKSTLFHVMITNLALWYSPDELEFYLIDFKKGVEFKAYAAHALPHARVIAVESEREFGLSVLRRLDAELSNRGQLFREAGAQDIASFRRLRPDIKMPRILFAVDEFQEFFVEDDRLAQDASLLLDRLVRQGRAFGMHLVLGSQTLGGAFSIARSTIGQMAVRIALQSSEQDSYLIMSEDNTAPRLLTRPGEAIYNDQSGAVEGNSPFQIVWLGEEERESELTRIAAHAKSSAFVTSPAIIFEGNLPANVESDSKRWITTTGVSQAREPRLWLGDAVSIKEPTSAWLRRRSGGNLLLIGSDEDAMSNIQLIGMLSLLRQHPDASVRLLDASLLGESDRPALGELGDVGLSSKSFTIHDSPADVLSEALAAIAMRESAPAQEHPPMYLFINGIHRFRDLRKSDDFDFSTDPNKVEKPSESLARVLREGPLVGVHVVVWCDGVNNLERYLSRQVLREFALRVVCQMSASDSTHVIDSPAAQSLGRNRALLYDDETASIEKFRPYSKPSGDWIKSVVQSLSAVR